MNKWIITPNKILSKEEVKHLYKKLTDAKDLAIYNNKKHCHIRDCFIIKLLLETGLRCFELANLKIGDLYKSKLIVKNGKGGKTGVILLTKHTKNLFLEYIKIKNKNLKEPTKNDDFLFLSERRKNYTTRAIRKRVKYWFNECGFSSELSVHSCRHTYISFLVNAGVDLITVRDNARHSNISVTSTYLHTLKEDLGNIKIFE